MSSPAKLPAKLPAFAGYCRPGQFAADARAHAAAAQRGTPLVQTARALDVLMQRLLGLLLLVLLTWAVSCKAARPEAHDHRAEKATPGGRYAWREADTLTE